MEWNENEILADADRELQSRLRRAAEYGLRELEAVIPSRKSPRRKTRLWKISETAFVEVDGYTATFGFTAPQAYWYDRGTSHQPARPVFRTAFQNSVEGMLKIISGEE